MDDLDLAKVFGAKLAAHEKMIEILLVEVLERYEHPIAQANELTDALADSETTHRDPRVPQELQLRVSEDFNQIVDRAIGNLQRRGHQQ